MAQCGSKRPFVSVCMVVRDGERHVSRAIESVVNQQFSDVQLVLAVMDSRDQSRSICERAMERDIRIDMIESAEERYDAALDEALDAARGSYILFMEQDDWLAPGSLEAVSHEVRAHELELAVLSLSMDTPSPRDGVHSHVVHLEPRHTEERDEFRGLVPGMLESGIMGSVRGKVFSADRIAELGLRFTLAQEQAIFLIRYIEDVQRAGAVPAALYHAAVRMAGAVPGSLDAYMLCEREYAAYCELAQKWSRERDEQFMRAIHTRHLHRLIACIKDAYGIAGLSGIERNERVRDILEAPSTRDTVDALGKKGYGGHRDFGFMYAPIAQKNVPACYLGMCLDSFVKLPKLPFMHPVSRVAL